MTITIVVGNWRWHVEKVFFVDMDPQDNASTLIARSTGVTKIKTIILKDSKTVH